MSPRDELGRRKDRLENPHAVADPGMAAMRLIASGIAFAGHCCRSSFPCSAS